VKEAVMYKKSKEPFNFCSRQNLTYLTSRKAKNIKGLLAGIKEVDVMSIYHHTHRYLEQHQFLSPEPVNDFAFWVTNMLQDRILGEKIASIDLKQFNSLEEIRSRFIEVIENSLEKDNRLLICDVPPGEEYHFMGAQAFIYPTKYLAHDLKEFLYCLGNIPINSVLYHFTEARFYKTSQDVSGWLSLSIDESELAYKFSKLDPYTMTEENLRKTLIVHTENRLKEIENDQDNGI
jgi:hypothetical protein